MSTRYGDRDFGRYGDADEERNEERTDERDADRGYGREGDRYSRGSGYDASPRGYASGRSGDYGRDYDSEREHNTRDYGSREYGSRYGREGTLGGYAGTPARRYESEDYGSRDYGTRDYGAREPGRDYRREYERGRERRPASERDPDRVRAFDTDYGRTTSRFYGRSGYEYGRDDYDDRSERGDARGDYGRRAYGGHPDERDARGRVGRGWWDRAADEVLSWFGDGDAERRRHTEEPREARGRGAGKFRGRGPKNYRRSDERIREELSDRLTENEWIDASDVEVRVSDGEVVLSGTVDSRYARRLAEDMAESVSGVSHVQNNLRVQNYQAGASGTAAATTAGASDIAATPVDDATGATDPAESPTPDLSSRAAGRS
jgi:osmotically-inducible protein OsmY